MMIYAAAVPPPQWAKVTAEVQDGEQRTPKIGEKKCTSYVSLIDLFVILDLSFFYK